MVIEGFAGALDALSRPRNASSVREVFQIRQIFGNKAFGRILESVFHVLPGTPVNAKAEWGRTRTINLELGVSVSQKELYRAEGIDDAGRMLIAMKGRIDAGPKNQLEIELPGGKAVISIENDLLHARGMFSLRSGRLRWLKRKGSLRFISTFFKDQTGEVDRKALSSLHQTIELRCISEFWEEECEIREQ